MSGNLNTLMPPVAMITWTAQREPVNTGDSMNRPGESRNGRRSGTKSAGRKVAQNATRSAARKAAKTVRYN